MNESRAWLGQSFADFDCVEILTRLERPSAYCHAIAKSQQAIEKSIKALVVCLNVHRAVGTTVGWSHGVERFISGLLRVAKDRGNQDLRGSLHHLLDEPTRSAIRYVDSLAPRRPPPGMPPTLNTEYPFQVDGDWHFPAEDEAFSHSQLMLCRNVSYKVVQGCSRLISAMERGSR